MDSYRPGASWVATPPPGAYPGAPARRRSPYVGPPSYAAPPRWGFPALAWRWPTSVPGTRGREPVNVDRVRVLARQAVAVLLAAAGTALFGAGGEIWRYVLLVQSRAGAMSRTVVDTSDAMVITAALLSITFGLAAAAGTLRWLFLARDAAAELGGAEPARPGWQVLVCLLVPGVNLVVPGATLAELEHAVLRHPVDERPRPSRAVLAWWVAWVVGGLLFTLTLLWRLRTSVQAQADGVLLNALTYVAAAVVAVLTVSVVRRLTTLLVPIDPARVRFMRVIKIDGAPAPPLRPGRPAGSVR
ncbi:MAG: DUF4328 domain-containing protein [Labedaea sp.]